MKKVLFLSLFAMAIATMSVTTRDDQNSGMNKITESVPTIKQTATVEMPFVITNDVQSIDCVVLENELNYDATIESPRSELFVFSSKTTPVVYVRELTSWQSNGKLFSNNYNKRIPNLGFNYIEGRSTEYRNC